MMPIYRQTNRALRVKTALPEDALLLVGLRGSEGISELFEFHLELLAPAFLPIDFEKVLGKPVSVTIDQEIVEQRFLHGLAVELEQGRTDKEFTRYEMTVRPKLWWATQRRRSCIFQQQTVVDILKQVFDGLETRFELSETYPSRNYCVQYHETDYDFACRLMEEEGIFFFHEFAEDKHTLVLADANVNLPEIARPNPLIFEPADGGLRDDARVTAWTKRQRLGPAQVTLWDHSFELPGQNLQADEMIQAEVQVGSVEHKLQPADASPEVYEYPGAYAKRFDGVAPGGGDRASDPPKTFDDNERTCKLRMQEIAAQTIALSGQSNCSHLTAGHQFELARHDDADGKYVLTRIMHQARLPAGYRSDEEATAESDASELEYSNRFAAHPLALPYRPRRKTPAPRIAGVQTATVVGPADAEVFVDKYGRVKAQFHWDREGKNDPDSSCWIRVAQAWAGNRWGAFFWPRIGHEVVVAFVEGDPDRPLIVGSVYNAANMPPLEVPADAKIGGIKSCIFGGDPLTNFNALLFHDAKGHEYVQVHSERREMRNSEKDEYHYVPHKRYTIRGSI